MYMHILHIVDIIAIVADLTNLEPTIAMDACMVIPQTDALLLLLLLRRRFSNMFPMYF